MSEILEKNLSLIKKYNPSLCNKVLYLSEYTKCFELNTNLAGEYNLLVDGKAVHSISGAAQESADILQTLAHNTQNSIHVIYGLGLGYLLDEFSQKAKGSIILLEDDIEILRFVLEVVDLSSILNKENIFLVSDLEEFSSAFESVFRYRSRITLSALDFYAYQKNNTYCFYKNELERLFTLYDHNYSFQVNTIYSFLQHTVLKLEKRLRTPLLTDYKDLLKDKPAVIVSAGPSLSKNIEVLKKYKDNVYIFCVGTALKTLLSNGIVPDFLNIIEKTRTSVHYEVPEIKDMTLLCEPYTNYHVHDIPFKRRFITASEETDSSRWFLEIAGKKLAEFETKGTVSYQALFSAKYWGCNPIILIGQDLAYSDGSCYAKGSAFEDLECFFDEELQKYKIYPKNFEKYRDAYYSTLKLTDEQKSLRLQEAIEKFNSELVTVDGQNGEKLPTSNAYALFIEYISDFGRRFNSEYKLINASLGGAKIDGFDTMCLKDAFENFAPELLDKTYVFENINTLSDCDLKYALKNIKNELALIERIEPLYSKGCEFLQSLKKEMDSRKSYSQQASKLLQKTAELYVDLTNKYTNVSKLLRMITLKEHSEIAFLMKQNQVGSNLKFEDAEIFCNAFLRYFEDIPLKFTWIKKWLNITVKSLEGTINE